jgi:phosphoglycerol transferase
MLSWLSPRPELLLKALNVLCFVATILLFLSLNAKISGDAPSVVSSAVFLLLPLSAYTAYFMPETTYAFLFALLAWTMASLLPVHVVAGAVVSGVLVGAMLLVKPHALTLFLAVLLTLGALLGAPARFRPSRRSVLAAIPFFVCTAYLSLVTLNGILTRHFQMQPLLFVGEIYRGFLSQGALLTSWFGNARLLLGILCGHLIVFAALLAPAIAVGVSRMRDLHVQAAPAPDSQMTGDRRVYILICFAAFAALTAIGMTTNFTAQIALISPVERIRLHGRYYSYVFPLYLMLYFGLAGRQRRAAADDAWIRAGALVGCVAAAFLYYLQAKRIIYPFDYPEAFAFSASHGQARTGLAAVAVATMTYGGIVGAVASYAVIVWRGRDALFLYPLLLVALFTVSNVGVTVWQHGNSVGSAMLRADGRAMRQIIAANEQNQGLVVGSEWNGPLAYFMFNLGSSARVLVRPPGSALTEADIPPGARWVVLTDRYQPAFSATTVLQTPRIMFMRVQAGQLAAPPQ